MAKDRGIEQIEEITGDFLDIISKTIKKNGKVRILEAGCGYGVAMMGFVKRFGDKVELFGFNLNKTHGDISKMKEKAIEKGIFTKDELSKIKNLPKIVYCDASKKLPFSSDSFDFIYSRATVYLVDDKISFFNECNRVLKIRGLARVAPGFGSLSAPSGSNGEPYGIEIWDKGKKIEPKKYFNKIKCIKFIDGPGKKHYLEIKKSKEINFGLKLVSSIDYNFIWHEWMGVKSIYSTQINFKPHWKS